MGLSLQKYRCLNPIFVIKQYPLSVFLHYEWTLVGIFQASGQPLAMPWFGGAFAFVNNVVKVPRDFGIVWLKCLNCSHFC